jgi:hypothetical protein
MNHKNHGQGESAGMDVEKRQQQQARMKITENR